MPESDKSVGIDLGIEYFATFDDGKVIENPRFFKQSEKELAKAQRKVSNLKKGTRKRRKKVKQVSKIHKKISNQRKNFCHQESRKIIDKYQNIYIEDINIKKMIQGSHYAKSITDASWNQFRQYLTYKAEYAGRNLGLVNPAYTTQDCSKCRRREKKEISERIHVCKTCGYTAPRDKNSGQNIKALGIDSLGKTPRSFRL